MVGEFLSFSTLIFLFAILGRTELGMVAIDRGGVRDLMSTFIFFFKIHFLIRHFRSHRVSNGRDRIEKGHWSYFNIHFLFKPKFPYSLNLGHFTLLFMYILGLASQPCTNPLINTIMIVFGYIRLSHFLINFFLQSIKLWSPYATQNACNDTF